MDLKEYLSERLLILMANAVIMMFISMILYICKVNLTAIIIIDILYVSSLFLVFFYEYRKKNIFFKEVNSVLDNLDEKFLLSEIINEPNDAEYREFIDILRKCNKSMNDKINSIDLREREFREFIELWVHEVKTPIASSKLTIENHKNKVTESIEEDLVKIEYYIEQALFYARSGSVNKDFLIKKSNIEKIVNNSIRKYSKILIKKRVKIVKENLDLDVYSDRKWIEFILGQIISNSLKYLDKDEKILEFKCTENDNSITLMIKDNGIGIEDKYLDKVFDKGFTGNNGRQIKNATGIGLYLCKKLSDKIHLNIKISSKQREYTAVYITFPKSSQFFLK
ncbi:hypothetical protein SAMN04487886_11666 [Clostridium sp. DSM 8431]|uniref:sensor histidine kinase n=1 Tax=Clostridium sp. DSM 8431 TaxID=1761781 RepID=UPI0008EC730E|nr:sensor histidine kinase [Clostridium sp. DSM 8431]SFU79343.1 hypothetical protein SAMN04487886_11666 [Clostridium sp. DSM 8431]